jgi:hypothetical protein
MGGSEKGKASAMNSYEIRVKGHLDPRWSAWFEGLTITYQDDCTVLRGPLADEAMLHGVLMKVRDLALPLIALSREDTDGPVQEETVG